MARQFAETIRAIRATLGLKQAELAAEASISRQALAAIESGIYLPNVAIAVRLAKAIGLTVEELFGPGEQDIKHQFNARWKDPPAGAVNQRRVVLARVRGKMVALALPAAHLTLPASSGVCLKHTGGGARVATPLLHNEIDAKQTLIRYR